MIINERRDRSASCVEVDIEEDVECECKCMKKKEDCNELQTFQKNIYVAVTVLATK